MVPDAMPNATLGHHVVALGSWFHYGFGVTISQVREILASHLHTQITAGGLVDGWRRLAEALLRWYEQIGNEARAGGAGAVLHADETGWRVAGATWWLWCFCNLRSCCYLIDPSRGSSALQKFFIEAYEGTLVSDFWAAYNNVWSGDKQKCLAHLLREILKVEEYNLSIEWKLFGKQLKRLIHYDRVINGSDYTLIDNAFNRQRSAIQTAVATSQIFGSGNASAVPEPAIGGVPAFSMLGFLARRRSRSV